MSHEFREMKVIILSSVFLVGDNVSRINKTMILSLEARVAPPSGQMVDTEILYD
jgi:hypothetical protein